ncbi:hypothetical protein BGX21_002562 [Mortierella sp. AD011]|nr:hypothetical protein BGX21_002562 [Mortierella sp. AD011]
MKRRGSAATATTSNKSHAVTSNSSKKASKRSDSKGNPLGNGHDSSTTTGDTKSVKEPRQPTAPSVATPSKSQLKTQKSKSKNTSQPQPQPQPTNAVSSPSSPAPASASTPAEPNLQKRVLPSRGRDKTGGIPIELALFEPTLAPAGEYILYLANKRILQKAAIDLTRVPPATYSGGSEDVDAHQPTLIPQHSMSSSSSSARTEIPISAPPPSAATHIEVPIFKPCTITQFLQEEKKRKMLLLSRALAKAEAEAVAQSRANTSSSLSTRVVSTRQKHKEIIHNQPVSVQTAAPSSSSLSSPYGRKATTTNTTLGKIEGVSLNSAQEEVLTDEVYEKRHRKQEMAEKKFKNREKEKLRHAMYQQQLVVERLRHIDINRLMPISAFRSLQKTVEHEQQQHKDNSSSSADESSPQAPISLAAARVMQDEYRRRLLREAEENLRRYEQLGLGENSSSTVAPAYSSFSRTRNRLAALLPILSSHEQTPSGLASNSGLKIVDKQEKKEKSTHQRSDSTASRSGPAEARIRKKAKTVGPTSTGDRNENTAAAPVTTVTGTESLATATTSVGRTKSKKTPSQKSSTLSSTSAVKPEEPPKPPKPITTFIKPGSILASGARKSSRVALAFGEKVPILERIDFDLPLDIYGDLIRERVGEYTIPVPDVKKKSRRTTVRPAATATLKNTDGGEMAKGNIVTSKLAEQPSSSPSSSTSSSSSSFSSLATSMTSLSSISSFLSQSKST